MPIKKALVILNEVKDPLLPDPLRFPTMLVILNEVKDPLLRDPLRFPTMLVILNEVKDPLLRDSLRFPTMLVILNEVKDPLLRDSLRFPTMLVILNAVKDPLLRDSLRFPTMLVILNEVKDPLLPDSLRFPTMLVILNAVKDPLVKRMQSPALKDFRKLPKRLNLNQPLPLRRSTDLRMLQHPGVLVKDKHRMQPRSQCRIDIRLRTVPNHPGRMRRALMPRHNLSISRRILLRRNLHRIKMLCQPRPRQLIRLLGLASLGHKNQSMPRSQLRQQFRHARQQLNLMLRNAPSKAANLRLLVLVRPRTSELLKARN
jgi:hypothetical protein